MDDFFLGADSKPRKPGSGSSLDMAKDMLPTGTSLLRLQKAEQYAEIMHSYPMKRPECGAGGKRTAPTVPGRASSKQSRSRQQALLLRCGLRTYADKGWGKILGDEPHLHVGKITA